MPCTWRPEAAQVVTVSAASDRATQVLRALLRAWRTAEDGHIRALALQPLALLATHCRREFLAAVVFVWETTLGAASLQVVVPPPTPPPNTHIH